jgi:hypothetical protein
VNRSVIHPYTLPVVQLLNSLKEHARLHHLRADETYYWIYAFAKNTHSMDDELSDEERSASLLQLSPFLRALKPAHGTLLILDQQGKAFSRSWIGFESCLALKLHKREKKFEIGTCNDDGAVIMTHGLCEEDEKQGQLLEWSASSGPYGHKVSG